MYNVKEKIRTAIGLIFAVIGVVVVFNGHKIKGLSGIGVELLGLALILVVVFLYNRKYK